MPEYCFKGWAPRGVPAQIVGDELERIRKANGEQLDAKQVVENARPDGAPLHNVFIWDDSKAAELWRVCEARKLIRSMCVRVVGSKPEPAFVNIKVEGVQYYQAVRVAIRHRDEWQSALDGLLENVNAAHESVIALLALTEATTGAKPEQSERLKNARRAIRAARTAVGWVIAA